ncbi:DUF6747 family protein [Maribacter sp. ACAM166]|uniref:DUF6747 family protein n=1 Tax=Maribacter sp. ACAM166 TaxID=2508996 RepID=UPI00397739ED
MSERSKLFNKEKTSLVKELYTEAFRSWRSYILENNFVVFSWLCLILIALAID